MLQAKTSNSSIQRKEELLPFSNNVSNRTKITNFLKEKVQNEIQSLNQKVENYRAEHESLQQKFIECHKKILKLEQMDLVKQSELTKENFRSLTEKLNMLNNLLASSNERMVTEERVNLLCNKHIENLNVELIGKLKTICQQNSSYQVTINQIQRDFEEHKNFYGGFIDAKLKNFEQIILSEGTKTNGIFLNDFKNPLQEMADLTNKTFLKVEEKLSSLAIKEESSQHNLQLLNQRLKLNSLAEKQNKRKIETSIQTLLEKVTKIDQEVLQSKKDIESLLMVSPKKTEDTLASLQDASAKDILIRKENQRIILPNKRSESTSETDKINTKTYLPGNCGNTSKTENNNLESNARAINRDISNREKERSELKVTLLAQNKLQQFAGTVILGIKNQALEEQDLTLLSSYNEESILNKDKKHIDTETGKGEPDRPINITLMDAQIDNPEALVNTGFHKDKDLLGSCTKEKTQEYQGQTAVASEGDDMLTIGMDKYANFSSYKSGENLNNTSGASKIPSAVKKTIPLLLCVSALGHYLYSNYKRR